MKWSDYKLTTVKWDRMGSDIFHQKITSFIVEDMKNKEGIEGKERKLNMSLCYHCVIIVLSYHIVHLIST